MIDPKEIPVVQVEKTIGDVTVLSTPELLAAHDRTHIIFRSPDHTGHRAGVIDSHAKIVDQLFERGLAHPPPTSDGLDGQSVPFEIHSEEQPENYGCDPEIEKQDGTLSKKMIIEQRNRDEFPALCQICKASPASFDTWFEDHRETCAALCLKCLEWSETHKRDISIPILKLDEEKRVIVGIVLEPFSIDSQKDTINAEVIESASWNFLADFGKSGGTELGLMHKQFGDLGIELVESYIVREDRKINRKPVKKGSWVIAVRVKSEGLWQQVKSGQFTGFSIGGVAVVE